MLLDGIEITRFYVISGVKEGHNIWRLFPQHQKSVRTVLVRDICNFDIADNRLPNGKHS